MAVAVVDVQVNGSNAVSQLRQINSASRTAEAGVGGLRKAVVGLAAAIGAVRAAKFVFAKTAELESQTRSLQVLTGSVRQAKEIIEELQQLGAVTPFTSTELIDAAKRLQAFGVEGNRVVEVTRRLADASGATGAELQGIVTAYGQVVAKGRLQGEELLQFQERGIGLQQELQKMYKLSGQELQDALSKGRISAEAVEAAIQRLTSTGGKYANGAIAQSDTLSGRLSTLQDGVDQLARRIGQVLTPALKAVFNQAIAVVDAVNQALSAGRGGGFTRSVFGARQALNVGATSQAVDNIAKGISQVTSQKNKAGIEQNLQALQKYQRLLQSIGPDDPNAGRAVELQGLILQKINQNIAAQKQLNKQAKAQADIFKIPELTAPTAGKGGKGGKGTRKDILEGQLQLEAKLLEAQVGKDRLEQAYLEKLIRRQRILSQELMPQERMLALLQSEFQYSQQIKEIRQDIAGIMSGAAIGPSDVFSEGADGSIFTKGFDESKQHADELKEKLQNLVSPLEQVKSASAAVADAFSQGISGMVQGTVTAQQALAGFFKSVAQSFLDMATEIIKAAIRMMAFNIIQSLFPGAPKFSASKMTAPGLSGKLNVPGILPGISPAGALASGGTATGGRSYLVGEKGPELFTPGRTGSIAPNNALGGANVTVNVDASGSNVQGNQPDAAQLGRAIGAAVQAELIKQKRPGGLLA